MCREFLKWWPYYNGHYLLNKGIDLTQLLNDHGSDQVMDMLDNLLIADSVYDQANNGQVMHARASLNKDYGRIGSSVNDEQVRRGAPRLDGSPNYLEPNDDGIFPGLEGIPMMGE